MPHADTERPYKAMTATQLKELAARGLEDIALLHRIHCELLFRERKAARDLRESLDSIFRPLTGYGEYFPWPTTTAPAAADDADALQFPVSAGIMGFLGYRVGATGITPAKRQELLDYVYRGNLPSINSQEYMDGWGAPQSGARLRKMAESIAAFVRNSRRRNPTRLRTAVAEWESDLAFLKRSYYEGRYDFPWPTSSVDAR